MMGNNDLNTIELLTVAFGGIVGSLTKDILNDGYVELPHKHDGKLYLGFFGGAVIGAFVGMAIDGNFVTALLAGYTGTSVIKNLLNGSKSK